MKYSSVHGRILLAPALATAALSSVGHAADVTQSPDTTIQEIVITASPIAHNADQFATIVDTVDRSQILQQGGANLADALANTPGVTGTSFAAGASRPVIRGFDANRVRVLEDGIGSFDVSDIGPDHGVPIDPLSAQRIEVVRGAATLRYGSQAIGGVVNAINNRVPMTLPDKPFSAELSGSYGSNASTGEGSALMDARSGQFAFHADGFARHSSDYGIPEGTQDNSFFRGDGYSLGSSYFFGGSHIGAGLVHYDAQYGIPSDTTYIDMKQTKGMLRSSFDIGSGAFKTLNVDGGYADYQHEERNPDGTINSTFIDKEWDARSEGIFGQMGVLSGTALGVQLQHRDFSALGEDSSYLFPTTTSTVAVFGFAEAPLSDKAHLEVGTRVEQVKIQGTPASNVPTDRTFTPVSGSVGLVYDATKQVGLGLMLTSAARAPAQTELFARGPHDGPGTFETGDPTLEMERANSIEGTLRLRYSAVRVDTSLWMARFNNYIYGDLTGRTCDEDGICVADNSQEFKELNYRQRDATFRGAETKLTMPLLDDAGHGQLDGQVFGDYVRATFDGGAGNVPRIPPWHVGAGLRWAREQAYCGLTVRYSAEQTQTAAGETPTAGFTSVDAYLGWESKRPGANFDVSLIGHNLTDSEQHNAVAINKDVVTLPGRDLRLVARFML
jgi:iron complex outermembrane receptor protein